MNVDACQRFLASYQNDDVLVQKAAENSFYFSKSGNQDGSVYFTLQCSGCRRTVTVSDRSGVPIKTQLEAMFTVDRQNGLHSRRCSNSVAANPHTPAIRQVVSASGGASAVEDKTGNLVSRVSDEDLIGKKEQLGLSEKVATNNVNIAGEACADTCDYNQSASYLGDSDLRAGCSNVSIHGNHNVVTINNKISFGADGCLSDLLEMIERLTVANRDKEEQREKEAAAFDAFLNSGKLYSIGQVAQSFYDHLGFGRNKFYEMLRKDGFIQKEYNLSLPNSDCSRLV